MSHKSLRGNADSYDDLCLYKLIDLWLVKTNLITHLYLKSHTACDSYVGREEWGGGDACIHKKIFCAAYV